MPINSAYRFGGYIHAKAIPGTSPELVQQLGYLADRLSVNVELPSERSLNLPAPDADARSLYRVGAHLLAQGAVAFCAAIGARNEETRQAVLRAAGSLGSLPAEDFVHEELAWRLPH